MQSLINNWVRGVDTYTHNGSTWLIFTDSKRWVIELTEDKTLWYNYNFFKQIFSLTSLDVVQNQHLITKWVEDNVMNKVNYTFSFEKVADYRIEDTLENGVKETKISPTHTEYGDWLDGDERLDEIIKNGVKETIECDWKIPKYVINEVIIEGVKETTALDPSFSVRYINGYLEMVPKVGKIIKNGVKHTFNTEYMPKSMVVDIIENGVKCSIPRQYVGENIIDKIIDNRTKNPTG